MIFKYFSRISYLLIFNIIFDVEECVCFITYNAYCYLHLTIYLSLYTTTLYHSNDLDFCCISKLIVEPNLYLLGFIPHSWLPLLTGLSWPNFWVGKYEIPPY